MRMPSFEVSEGSGLLWRFARLLLPRGWRFDLYTDEARQVLFFAHYSVTESGGAVLLPVHLLLGVLRANPAVVQRFAGPDGSADAVRTEILQDMLKAESVQTSAEIPFSREARRVLRIAGDEASRTGGTVHAEHLLLALLLERGTAGNVLRRKGVREGDVRTFLRHVSGGTTEA
jgi:ATP-dependent Clp protease ATP-binding subunit ClpC